MQTQNQIKRTLSEESSLLYLNDLLAANPGLKRADIVREVCRKFHFYDTRGQQQEAGCAKALRSLDASGHIRLPAPLTRESTKKSPQRLNVPVPPPEDVPSTAGAILALELILVQSNEHKQIWNELMFREHPRGTAKFVGRQLRYLIHSAHGYLGGIGFAAPALQLTARDRWIGWDKEQRQRYLHYVVGMSRFLIRPAVRCQNLASKVLSLSIEQMAADFEAHYGYRPLLVESFVDEDWSGTCYQAANWVYIGKTQGRGRQDTQNQYALTQKAAYLYAIDKDFRKILGLSANAGLGPLKLTTGLDGDEWAQHEFGGAPLGNKKLGQRLVTIAQAKGQSPGRSFSGVFDGEWAKTKATYRFLDKPDESAVNMENILAPHRARTVRRMMAQETVLCIQDGSELNYTNLKQCQGLGFLKANQTGAKTKGLNLHSTFTVTPGGLPLGVIKAQCIAPREKDPQDKRKPAHIPIEEKKTFVWVEHHRDLVELSKQMPQTRLVHVCDREADFFDLFDEQRQTPGVELLVRASHNRNIDQAPHKLFAAVRQAPVLSRLEIPIARQSARAKKSKQKARKARPARLAQLALRSIKVEIPPPEYHKTKLPIDCFIVHAVEENPPDHTDPVEWFLLTTMTVNQSVDAEQCLRWYALRWRIEDWHRVLKSGCKIEDLALETAQRLRRAIAIHLVIAWRIMLMTLLGRETPELPADILFSDIELRTLEAYAKKTLETAAIAG